jgi:hypothetical protein
MGILGDDPSKFEMTAPPGQAQPFNWKKGAAVAGGGVLAALLGSKLSGGNVTFGEAIGHLGKGFADKSYEQMEKKREWEHQAHGQQLKMIHDFFSSGELEGLDTTKFPKIKELQAKYAEKLTNSEKGPSGEPLSPKETTELLGMLATVKGDIGLAKREKASQDALSGARTQQQAKTESIADLFMQPPPGGVGSQNEDLPPEVGREEALGLARNSMRRQYQNELPRPVNDPRMRALLGPEADAKTIGGMANSLLDHDLGIKRIEAQATLAEKSAKREFGRQLAAGERAMFHDVVTKIMFDIYGGERTNPTTGQPITPQEAAGQALAIMNQFKMKPPPGGANPASPGGGLPRFRFDQKTGQLVPITGQ